jgi:hypothetical protein
MFFMFFVNNLFKVSYKIICCKAVRHFRTIVGSFKTGVGSFKTGVGSFKTGVRGFKTGVGSFKTSRRGLAVRACQRPVGTMEFRRIITP